MEACHHILNPLNGTLQRLLIELKRRMRGPKFECQNVHKYRHTIKRDYALKLPEESRNVVV